MGNLFDQKENSKNKQIVFCEANKFGRKLIHQQHSEYEYTLLTYDLFFFNYPCVNVVNCNQYDVGPPNLFL